jgi:hypothetical protein
VFSSTGTTTWDASDFIFTLAFTKVVKKILPLRVPSGLQLPAGCFQGAGHFLYAAEVQKQNMV